MRQPGVRPFVAVDRFVDAGQPPSISVCERQFGIACYNASEMRAAYDVQRLPKSVTGKGETIVLVDSFGSPTIKADLAAFDRGMGLPAPPSFKVIRPAGGFAWNADGDSAWAGEATLDVEWSHAMAPGASLLLVETPTAETEGTGGIPQMATAERYVVDHHLGSVISQSWGATEATFQSSTQLAGLDAVYAAAAKAHITVLASTGDTGAAGYSGTGAYLAGKQVEWPSTDPLVTAVGGTELHLDASGSRTSPDSAWNDSTNANAQSEFGGDPAVPLATGGGLSRWFSAPAYQATLRAINGGRRSVPDIDMSASCSGAVDVYQSFAGLPDGPGWYFVCGTSEASPLFAGVVALADQEAGHLLGLVNPRLYALEADHARGIVDVTRGNNTVSYYQPNKVVVHGYPARSGYDLVSGVGTADVGYLVPELAAK